MDPPSTEMLQERNVQRLQKPPGSRVVLNRTPRSLYIVSITGGVSRKFYLYCPLLIILIASPGLLVQIARGNINSAGIASFVGLLVVGFAAMTLIPKGPYSCQVLHIGPQTYAIWKDKINRVEDAPMQVDQNPSSYRVSGQTNEISMVELIITPKLNSFDSSGYTLGHILIKEGLRRKMKFGKGLGMLELEWILQEVNSFIGQ